MPMIRNHDHDTTGLLIRRAELLGGRIVDVRLRDGRIAEIGDLPALAGEYLIEAGGGLLLPGLHDHHIHVSASAAALASARCGPPEVVDADGLARVLARPGHGWLRGIGYHESVAGMIDRDWLDAAMPERPVRVQHRSGRMWVFNSAGLDLLLASGRALPAGLERIDGRWTGRLFDEDAWLRATLGSVPPPFDAVGADLARHGVTGVTEMSPANDDAMAAHFAAEHTRGALPQRVVIAGRIDLGIRALDPALILGPVKLHLHEEHLPPFEEVVTLIHSAHDRGRGIAVHCVTEVEMVFTLAALRDAGTRVGDRIEHASVANAEAVAQIAEFGLRVVAQPNFVAERGDAYRAMIPTAEWPDLYRLRSFLSAGVVLAGGSDAPFGQGDLWAAMAAAVSRRTATGDPLGVAEALTPEEALGLFLADPCDLSRVRSVETGVAADLCLLNQPWAVARENLRAGLVRSTLIGGRIVHDGINQAPVQRGAGVDPLS
jgi:predicted amidohydrolase YtcJ